MNNCVLIITSHYPPNIGGVESHLQALIDGLRSRNWEVIISTYQPLASKIKASRVEKRENLTIYRMRWPGFNLVHTLFNYPILEFLYLFPGLFLVSLRSLIKHKNITVIHGQGLVPSVVGLILGKIFSKRVVSSIHNLYFFPKNGLYKNFARIIFSSVDQVLTPSNAARKELLKIGVPQQRVGDFRYWIDLKIFTPNNKQNAKRKLSYFNKLTIFFVGRLIETKGVNLLLEIVKRIQNINFVIAGTGPLELMIRKVADKYPNLHYLGRIENQSLPLYYSAADLVIVPSLVDEGFGFVVMEAVACGTPVLVSNRGGLLDAVSVKTGLVFEPTIYQLEKKLNYITLHKKTLKNLEKNCRKYALSNFSAKNIEDIIKIYG